MDLDSAKRALREEMRRRRAAVRPEEARAAGRALLARLKAAPELTRASLVGMFASLPDEPSTEEIFRAFVEARMSVVLPRMVDRSRIEFLAVRAWGDLVPGRYGLLEPAAGSERVDVQQIDLVLVPGVAFDRACNRLGRGRGYYDRAFPSSAWQARAQGGSEDRAGGPVLFGVGFGFQLVESVPVGPRDRRLDAVLTESELIRPGPSGADDGRFGTGSVPAEERRRACDDE